MTEGYLRGAADAAPRTGPLTIVTAAVAGDDLQSVARSAADALGWPVAISLPEFGSTVAWPPGSSTPQALQAVRDYADALRADATAPAPAELTAVPVRIGLQVIGVVAALAGNDVKAGSWLEAAAAAAAVTALMRDASGFDDASARRAVLQMVELHAPANVDALLAQARRLGCELSAGGIGLCADPALFAGLATRGTIVADMGDGRVLGLVSPTLDPSLPDLRATGHPLVLSVLRDTPALLHEALREAGILFELAIDNRAQFAAHEETYRLLLKVQLSDPDELERLRSSTIAELERYDEVHDTELVGTLEAFLAHHGSTTETAEAMSLHRHTVGYRLARVQEVSGLSPHESDGRERLGLGLKAHRLIRAERRLAERRRAA